MNDQTRHPEPEEASVSMIDVDDGAIAAEAESGSLVENGQDVATTETEVAQDTIDEGPMRPADIPEKFWDSEAGALRTKSLLKSYLELEKKLGTMVPMPNDGDPSSRDRLQRVLGKPESADDYAIDAPHELITPDPAINAKLHQAGLSAEQAQIVYNLAAEHFVPLLEEMSRESQQKIERSQLAAHFGGEEKWQAMAPQIKTWAKANLNDDLYDSLGSSTEGVVAMYHMMQAREPNVISETAVPAAQVDKQQLSQMMRDPRYWRDRDPAFVAEVTAGYKQLFD